MGVTEINTVEKAVRAFESEIKLPTGFLESLRKEDDWSFVIKAHALIEAAITHTLVAFLDKPQLEGLFARMELTDKRSGKLAFATALEIISEDERRFLRAFSEIRNSLVHNISNVSFDFKFYIAHLDPNQLRAFSQAFSYFAGGESFEYQGRTYSTDEFVRLNPKDAAWFCVMVVVGVLYVMKESEKLKMMIASLEQEVAVRLTQAQGDSQQAPPAHPGVLG